jgi:hypothetical protein
MEGLKYHDLSIESSKEEYQPNISCNVKLAEQEDDAGDYTKMSVLNMSFPFLVFFIGAFVAIIFRVTKKKSRDELTKGLRRLSSVISTRHLPEQGKDDPDGESPGLGSASENGLGEDDLFVTTCGNIDSIARRVQELIEAELDKEKKCV